MSELVNEATPAPITCRLGSVELGRQVQRWKTLYAEAGTERAETDRGLRLCFRRDPAVEHELRELVAVELECCRWADWTVEVKADELVLAVTSIRDGSPLIHSWFLAEEPVLPTSRC